MYGYPDFETFRKESQERYEKRIEEISEKHQKRIDEIFENHKMRVNESVDKIVKKEIDYVFNRVILISLYIIATIFIIKLLIS